MEGPQEHLAAVLDDQHRLADHGLRGLDTKGTYLIRMTGMNEALLRINGELVKPTIYSKEMGQFKEFSVPQEALKNGKITLTFDMPDEEHLNWRNGRI